MDANKISALIEQENERREEHVFNEARQFIYSITSEQEKIEAANKRIAELRTSLKALEVSTVDAKAILGE